MCGGLRSNAIHPPEKEFACVSAKYLKSINYLVNPKCTKHFTIAFKSNDTLVIEFFCVLSGRMLWSKLNSWPQFGTCMDGISV